MEIKIFRYDSVTSTFGLEPHLEEINQLINDAFDSQDRSIYGKENIFTAKRVRSPDQVLQELGTEGIAAVTFDTTNPQNPHPVAVACLKPWKGRVIKSLPAAVPPPAPSEGDVDIAKNWEVSFCVSDVQYRKQGLVTKCLEVLYRRLREIRGGRTTFLWITTLEGVGNVEYWQRRGFARDGEVDLAPVGFWGSTKTFGIGTLKKTLD